MLRSKLSPRTGWLRMVLIVRSLLKNPLTLATAAGLALASVGCGHAEDEAVAEMERLQKSAIASLKKGKPQDARRDLLEAVRVGNEAGLEDEAVMAQPHLALGSVYVTLKSPTRAAAHLNAAIERDPEITLKGTLATPAAKKALSSVRAGEKLGPSKKSATAAKPAATPAAAPVAEAASAKPDAPATVAAEPAVAAPVAAAPVAAPVATAAPAAPRIAAVAAAPRDPLSCRIPDEAPPENEVFFRCSVRPDVKITRLLLHYRPAGQELFKEVTMARNKRGGYTGAIPAEATNVRSLQYFIEGRGPTKLENGNADSPNLILVREGAAPATRTDPFPGRGLRGDDDGDDDDRQGSENEDPLAEIAKERELERDREGTHRRAEKTFFVGFGLGSGFGWQTGGALEFRTEKEVGAGPLSGGLVALRPEVGYQLTDDLAVSIQARLQFIPAQGSGDGTPGSPIESAHSILLRATQSWGSKNLRPMVSAVVGGGQGFRLRVPRNPGENLARSDTVRGGPFLAGAGAGFTYHANQHVAWTLEGRALLGLPSIAALGEVSAGVEVGF
jgi:hypothetical protein